MNEQQLPPLPEAFTLADDQLCYTADQMQAYARAALEQLRCGSAQGVPADPHLMAKHNALHTNHIALKEDVRKISDALTSVGLTLIRTEHGYEVRRFGKVVAQATPPQAQQGAQGVPVTDKQLLAEAEFAELYDQSAPPFMPMLNDTVIVGDFQRRLLICMRAAIRLAATPAPPQAQQAASTFVVSVVMTKEIPTGINTQNKLYAITAASVKEAEGIAVAKALEDFERHTLHTVCHMATPPQAQQAAPLTDEQIDNMAAQEFPSGWWSMVRRLVRRVEKRYGIGASSGVAGVPAPKGYD